MGICVTLILITGYLLQLLTYVFRCIFEMFPLNWFIGIDECWYYKFAGSIVLKEGFDSFVNSFLWCNFHKLGLADTLNLTHSEVGQ